MWLLGTAAAVSEMTEVRLILILNYLFYVSSISQYANIKITQQLTIQIFKIIWRNVYNSDAESDIPWFCSVLFCRVW